MTGSCFQRFTPRDAMDIAIASACSQVTLEPGTGRIRRRCHRLGSSRPHSHARWTRRGCLAGT